jgi:hypothetical protein
VVVADSAVAGDRSLTTEKVTPPSLFIVLGRRDFLVVVLYIFYIDMKYSVVFFLVQIV